MGAVNITRIFDTAKAKATKSGQELLDFVVYTTEALSQVIAALRNNLSFGDNFNALITEPELRHNTEQIINTNNKVPKDVILTRTFSLSSLNTGFGWQLNGNNQLVVKALFNGAPATTVRVRLVILF
jgi:hypothetical protein